MTRDGFDFLVYYLSDYDLASHVHGPDVAHEALARSDDAVGALIEAAGGRDEFLERYAVILCADHGQTTVREVTRLQDSFPEAVVTASNRAAMVYADSDPAALARRLDGHDAVEVVLWREGTEGVARRDGAELRFSPAGTSGDRAILDYPHGRERAWAALANPNAGELLVSAAPGWEFVDLAGRHHAGGGSHGSLAVGDSEVPMLTVGLDSAPGSITEVMPAVLEHFGVSPPAYVRPLAHMSVAHVPGGVSSRSPALPGGGAEGGQERERRGQLAERLRRRGIRDGVLRRSGGPRALRPRRRCAAPRLRRPRAPDRARPDDLAAVHGRDHL